MRNKQNKGWFLFLVLLTSACSHTQHVRRLAIKHLNCAESQVDVVERRGLYTAFCFENGRSERHEYYHCGSYGCTQWRDAVTRAATTMWECDAREVTVTIIDHSRSILQAEGCGQKGWWMAGLDDNKGYILVTGESIKRCNPSPAEPCT